MAIDRIGRSIVVYGEDSSGHEHHESTRGSESGQAESCLLRGV